MLLECSRLICGVAGNVELLFLLHGYGVTFPLAWLMPGGYVSAEMPRPGVEPAQEDVVLAIVNGVDPPASRPAHVPKPGHSVPPRSRPVGRASRTTWTVRAALVLIAFVLIAVFAVAAWLNPYNPDGTPRRLATHRQLGLPPCNFTMLTGKPCPSCGMTTSFALFVRGDLRASFQANWVGTLLAATAVVALPWSLLSALRGRLLGIRPGQGDYLLTLAVALLLILMLGRWLGLLLTSSETVTANWTEDHRTAAAHHLSNAPALSSLTHALDYPFSESTGKTGGNGLHRGITDEPDISLVPTLRVGHLAGDHRSRL